MVLSEELLLVRNLSKNMSTKSKKISLKKRLLASLFVLMLIVPVYGQQETDVIFHFLPEKDMFYAAVGNNSSELQRLRDLVKQYRSKIELGKIPVYVNGYCSSLNNESDNLATARIRSNRVKSELIITKKLKELHFVTLNQAIAYQGYKDMVTVTIRIPQEEKAVESKQEEIREPQTEQTAQSETLLQVQEYEQAIEELDTEPSAEPRTIQVNWETAVNNNYEVPANDNIVEKEDMPLSLEIAEVADETLIYYSETGRYFALKTNIAAWVGTIMNVAAEVQVANRVSIELPMLWCPWKISESQSVKIFAVQPEVRRWLAQPAEGHFFGIHAHVGWYNVRWKDDRYQDAGHPLLGAGVSYGYTLPLSNRWAGEFTLGAGYANTRYDTFYNIQNGARINTDTRNYWGITRVGVSLVYHFDTHK